MIKLGIVGSTRSVESQALDLEGIPSASNSKDPKPFSNKPSSIMVSIGLSTIVFSLP